MSDGDDQEDPDSDSEWAEFLQGLVEKKIITWIEIVELVCGGLNFPQAATSLASKSGGSYYEEYEKGKASQAVMSWINEQKKCCTRCNSLKQLEFDHIIPRNLVQLVGDKLRKQHGKKKLNDKTVKDALEAELKKQKISDYSDDLLNKVAEKLKRFLNRRPVMKNEEKMLQYAADLLDNLRILCKRCNAISRPSHIQAGLSLFPTGAECAFILLYHKPKSFKEFVKLGRSRNLTVRSLQRFQEAWFLAKELESRGIYVIQEEE